MEKELYLYFDENGNPNVEDHEAENQNFGVGVVLTFDPIEQMLIEEGIKNLALKGALQSPDRKALERGYFHASYDGGEAHSEITKITNSLNLQFYYTTFDKKIYMEQFGEKRTEQSLHFHLVQLSALDAVDLNVKKANLFIAQRDVSFPQGAEERWKKYFYENLLLSIQGNPRIQTIFPDVTVQIVDGKNPGIQVVDFVLWATMRARRTNKANSVWYDRIKKKNTLTISGDNDPVQIHGFRVNEGIKSLTTSIIYNVTTIEFDQYASTLTEVDIEALWVWVIQLLKEFYQKKYQGYVYLDSEIGDILRRLDDMDISTKDDKQAIAKCFLMVFDTAQLHRGFTKPELIRAVVMKSILSSYL